MKHLRRIVVARYQPHGAFELMKGLPPAPLPEVNLPQVHEGELPRFVAFGLLGLFKPWDRLVQLVLLHQIDPDVVMRIAELGVDRDRPETLFGGFLQTALKAQGGVAPVSWTPQSWGGKERPRCRRAIDRTRQSFGRGSLSWCGRDERQRSWAGSSSPPPRRSGTG